MTQQSDLTLLGRHHDKLAAAHRQKLGRTEMDFGAWLDDIEKMIVDYYHPLLEALQQSAQPEDESLYNQLDRQYAARMAFLQAARERMVEAGAHLNRAIGQTK